jgi:DNA gyrase inhibitor GyrI
MEELKVEIVYLEPMRVAIVLGYGQQPEEEAWEKIFTFARENGLLADLTKVRFFGFNNPDPSPGSPHYGYEQWMTIGAEVEVKGDVEIKDFSGGLYAVTRCTLHDIGEKWKQLVGWWEASTYDRGKHQHLEECLTPDVLLDSEGVSASDQSFWDKMVLDLYLPISE